MVSDSSNLPQSSSNWKGVRSTYKKEPVANTYERRRIELRIIDLFLLGETESAIAQIILEEFPQLSLAGNSDANIHTRIQQAREHLITNNEDNFLNLAHTHVYIYEHIYKFFKEIDFVPGILKTLGQKEALLGQHSDDIVAVEMTNEISLIEEQVYNFDKLSEEEKEELKTIILKLNI